MSLLPEAWASRLERFLESPANAPPERDASPRATERPLMRRECGLIRADSSGVSLDWRDQANALHRELIRELRRKGRTYREVSRLFAERLGLRVAPSTLHSFVKVRARHRKQVQFELPAVELPAAQPPVSARLAAFKAKPTAQEAKRSRFVFRENEPLTLSTDGGAR